VKKKRGGKRKDAGRPTTDGIQGVKHYNVTLDEPTVDKAKQIGSGSLSVGIRKAVKQHP
jgi:hypothetical protein